MPLRLACAIALLGLLGLAGCESLLAPDPEMMKSDARWHVRQGDSEAALEVLRRTVEVAPDDVEAFALLAQVALRVERPGEAEQALRRASALDPRDPALRVARGVALTRLGRYFDAESALLDALLLHRGDPAALAALAEVYRISGRPERCEQRYAELLERWEGRPDEVPSEPVADALALARDRAVHCARTEAPRAETGAEPR